MSNQALLDALMQPINDGWRKQALCRGTENSLFFPLGTLAETAEIVGEAKAVCGRCEVAEECLQYSLETNQEAGVWGGYGEDERRRLRKRWLAERRRRRG